MKINKWPFSFMRCKDIQKYWLQFLYLLIVKHAKHNISSILSEGLQKTACSKSITALEKYTRLTKYTRPYFMQKKREAGELKSQRKEMVGDKEYR